MGVMQSPRRTDAKFALRSSTQKTSYRGITETMRPMTRQVDCMSHIMHFLIKLLSLLVCICLLVLLKAIAVPLPFFCLSFVFQALEWAVKELVQAFNYSSGSKCVV